MNCVSSALNKKNSVGRRRLSTGVIVDEGVITLEKQVNGPFIKER